MLVFRFLTVFAFKVRVLLVFFFQVKSFVFKVLFASASLFQVVFAFPTKFASVSKSPAFSVFLTLIGAAFQVQFGVVFRFLVAFVSTVRVASVFPIL